MMTAEFEIKQFKVLSTGVDGGHNYLSSIIEHDGVKRNITVFFKCKNDEQIIKSLDTIKVKGELQDEGLHFPLTLLESELIQ